MKCPHCGVHFDDSERICPLCGCRVSGKAKKDCQINTDEGFFREKKQTKKTFTHDQTFTKKFTTNPQSPIFRKRASAFSGKKSRKKLIFLIILVIVILPLLSSLFLFVSNLSGSLTGAANTVDNYVNNYEDVSDSFLGTYTDPAGRQLSFQEDNNFQLTENNLSYSGYYTISTWDYDNSAYPADAYTSYELYLSFDSGDTPMPGGEDYVFYEMYVPKNDPDIMILSNYEDSNQDVTFRK